MKVPLPRILIIDDVFGRTLGDRPNRERANLCGMYGLRDVTRDGVPPEEEVVDPIAEVVFCRGQLPVCADIGDHVENDLAGTLDVVRQGWDEVTPETPNWSLVLLDLCFYTGEVTRTSQKGLAGMPEGHPGDDTPSGYFGLRVLEALNEQFPDLPVIILSSMPRETVSEQFSRLGALGFLPRGDANSHALLRDYLNRHGLIPDPSGTVVGQSKGILLALRAARRAAASRKGVLLRGDTGTGKELLAKYLHDQTPEIGSAPFIAVDSGRLSPHLYGSELFGHRRGAFTGATHDQVGRIAQADGGDLFLDEIGNMPEDVQVGLLRAIDQREITPVGARDSQRVDVRYITATNVDIEGKAATGHGFRADLYYRLREGGVIYLPPLRDRKEDIPLLARKFLRDAEATTPNAFHRAIDPDALDILLRHDWPGNIRELRDTIFKAVADHGDVEYLMPVHLRLGPDRAAPLAPSPKTPVDRGVPPTQISMEEIARLLDTCDTEDIGPGDLAGKLPELQSAYARLIARLLRAAINATRRPTVENPEGDILIHPAMKLLSGDSALTASQAADLIKRLLKIAPDSIQDLLEDVVLAEALQTAIRLRPTGASGSLRRTGK